MAMKPDQQRYARQRIKEAWVAKLAELRLKFTKPATEPSDKDKLNAIRNGDCEIKRNVKLETPLGDAFDFRYLPKTGEFDEKGFEEAAKTLKKRCDETLDEVMLGDENVAIRKLREFCG
jgi:hypothetical protein